MFKRHGGWAFRLDVGFQPVTGKRKQMTRQGFATKKDAEAALAEALSKSLTNSTVARTTVRVKDYLAEWLASNKGSLRPTTLDSYMKAIRRINDQLGAYQLQALTPLQVQRFYNELLDHGGKDGKPLSEKTVRNTHVVFRKALADAEKIGLVPRNVAAATNPPIPSKPDHVTWTTENLATFLTAIQGDEYEMAYQLLASTGMRRGEVLGLRWRDVDLDLGELSVAHTITPANGGLVYGPPKTPKSRRNVGLDNRTVAMLRDHRHRQKQRQAAAGEAWSNDLDLVVTDELGGVIHPDALTREFDKFIRKLDVPRIRLHDLRHTHATLALKAGVHPKVVSERLGHANVGVTLDLYSHVSQRLAKDAADQIMGGAYRAASLAEYSEARSLAGQESGDRLRRYDDAPTKSERR